MRVLADGRVRRSEAEWRGLVERFEKSGLSMTTFCSRAKLPRSSFVKWKGRLGSKPAMARSARSAPSFVEWMAPPSVQASPERLGVTAGELELQLPGGVVLRWKA